MNLVDTCATVAITSGYTLFAISGRSCYGGIDISAVTRYIHSDGCSLMGNQSSTQSYQVYVNPNLAYTLLGCYSGFDTNSFVLSEGTASYDVNSCGAMAVAQSNLLFGFSISGTLCFVGNETAQVVVSANSQNCAIAGSFKVYAQTVSLSPQSVYQSIGCYKEDRNAPVIPNFQSSSSTPAQCAYNAEKENTKAIVFGLRNGECWTGNSVSSAISLSFVSNCPSTGSALANQVFVRKYCFPGWTTVSSYTGDVKTFACRQCATGHYCPGNNTEVPCLMDYSTEGNEGYSVCTKCDTSNGYSTIGLTGQSECTPIPNGYYYILGNTKTSYCGTNNKTQHWIGGGYNRSTCRCAQDWSGTLCEIPSCPAYLPLVSLGSLLFNSDRTLLEAPKLDILNTLRYLFNLLSVSIDVNGDGIISTDEMLNYLQSRSIYSTSMESFPLWYGPDGTSHSIYDVADMYNEAKSLYQKSPKYKFDGSGLTFISNLTSTFPKPSWNDSMCETYDVSRPNHKFVRTSWNFIKGYAIKKVCGYINGFRSNQFQTTKILEGNQTYFTDTSLLSETDSYKRVYCVFVYFLYNGISQQGFECSVGLFYVRNALTKFVTVIRIFFRMALRLT